MGLNFTAENTNYLVQLLDESIEISFFSDDSKFIRKLSIPYSILKRDFKCKTVQNTINEFKE